MSRTVSPSTGRRYGLALVCRVWEQARSSVYAVRSRRQTPPSAPRKRGPKTALTDAELTALIRETIESSPWLGEGYRKVWAQLRHKGRHGLQAASAAADAGSEPALSLAHLQIDRGQ